MSDRNISSPQLMEADAGTPGYCRSCGAYGYGTYDGRRTGITDWITSHVGCRLDGGALPGMSRGEQL